jgi:hypothetical protein
MADEDDQKRAESEDVTLDDALRLRINCKELNIFRQKAQRANGKPPSQLLREFITAYNDGRLRIIPTEDQKAELGELYVS